VVTKLNRITTELINSENIKLDYDVEGKEQYFKARALVELPEFVYLAPRQPQDVEFKLLVLNKKEQMPENEKEIVLNDVQPVCINNIGAYEVISTKKINVRIRFPSKRREPRLKDIKALTYCRKIMVEKKPDVNKKPNGKTDTEDKPVLEPADLLNIPIIIRDRHKRKYISVRHVNFNKTTLKFKKSVTKKSIYNAGKYIFVKPKKKPEKKK